MIEEIDYELKRHVNRRISREEFEAAFGILCSKKQSWKEYPLVTDILISYPYYFRVDHAVVIMYFLQTVAVGRSIFNIKFQEYINFIRRERDNKYKLNKKTKSSKFISNSAFTRCVLNRKSTVEDYIAIYLKDTKDKQYSQWLYNNIEITIDDQLYFMSFGDIKEKH